MKNAISNIQYIFEEKKIIEDFEHLKNNSKIKIKVFHNNNFEHIEHFYEKSKSFNMQIAFLERQLKNKLIKKYEIIKN